MVLPDSRSSRSVPEPSIPATPTVNVVPLPAETVVTVPRANRSP